jgi:hypothetical protein
MVGGEFNSSDVNELLSLGFTNEDIEFLSTVSPNINLIRQSLQQVNPETGSLFSPEEIMQSVHQAFNENDISQISNDEEDVHNEDFMYDYPESTNTSQESLSGLNLDNSSLDDSSSSFMHSLHDSDLNNSNISSANTSVSDTSMGGKKRRKTNKKRTKSKSPKSRKSAKSRRRIIKGGNCYGRGVGTNSYNPNFSIYNTKLLNLFPYKPTN